MKLVIKNLAGIVRGGLGESLREIDTLVSVDGLIAPADEDSDGADVVIDAAGSVAIPGLIDTHAHIVFGDWTPRQSTLGWIESSMHGGVTMMMSASEVHLPGRPADRDGVKALAVAAQRAYSSFRPGGVKVLAGSVIIEPGLEPEDFADLRRQGVWLAKVGFGAFESQADASDLVRAAQAEGFVVMNHTGGASIPGSSPVTAEDVIKLGCDIIGHANGGTTALPAEDIPSLFEAAGVLQIVQAGNILSSLRILEVARELDALDRVVLATDTPTGTGVMPLGMLKTVVEMSALAGISATDSIALATANNARVLRRQEGILEPGRPADIVLIQEPLGSAATDPLSAIQIGDMPAITAVVIDGEVKALKSRNTPAPTRLAEIVA